MDSVRVVVDGLFEEMVGQVKEVMLLPPPPPPKEECAGLQQLPKPFPAQFAQQHQQPKPPPLKSNLIFATKSKPVPPLPSSSSSFVVPGQKRTVLEGENLAVSSTFYNSPTKKLKPSFPDEQLFTLEKNNEEVGGGGESESDYYQNLDNAEDISDARDHFKAPTSTSNGNIVVEFYEGITPTTSAASTSFSAAPTNKKRATSSGTASSGKKFACTEVGCDKSYSTPRDLKVHTRCAHSGVKPFSCAFSGCPGFASADRSNTLRHIRNVHLKSGGGGGKGATEAGELSDGSGGGKDDDPAKYLTVQTELL